MSNSAWWASTLRVGLAARFQRVGRWLLGGCNFMLAGTISMGSSPGAGQSTSHAGHDLKSQQVVLCRRCVRAKGRGLYEETRVCTSTEAVAARQEVGPTMLTSCCDRAGACAELEQQLDSVFTSPGSSTVQRRRAVERSADDATAAPPHVPKTLRICSLQCPQRECSGDLLVSRP